MLLIFKIQCIHNISQSALSEELQEDNPYLALPHRQAMGCPSQVQNPTQVLLFTTVVIMKYATLWYTGPQYILRVNHIKVHCNIFPYTIDLYDKLDLSLNSQKTWYPKAPSWGVLWVQSYLRSILFRVFLRKLTVSYQDSTVFGKRSSSIGEYLVNTWWCHVASQNLLNIGSGNGLVPGGTKPLPEPIFTEYLGTNHSAISLNGYYIGSRNIFFAYLPVNQWIMSHLIPSRQPPYFMSQSTNPMPNTQH